MPGCEQEEAPYEIVVQAAMRQMNALAMADLVADLVDIDSPTGDESAVLDWIAACLHNLGLSVDRADDGSVIGAFDAANPGSAALLLYAPVDTHISSAEDRRRFGDSLNLLPQARRSGLKIAGLGAENPKGFVAALLGVAHVMARAALKPAQPVVFGFGAGGMPRGYGAEAGHGSGARAIVQKVRPDQAVILKPGWTVSNREVGLCWLVVEVHAPASYVGTRHLSGGESALQRAARLLPVVEAWIVQHGLDRRDGTLFPQGAVSAIRAGDPGSLAFTPEYCELFVDVRVTVGDTPEELAHSLRGTLLEELTEEGQDSETTVRVDPVMWVPAADTPDDAPVVTATRRAWREVATPADSGAAAETSGVTDAVVLRASGVPTARVGMPRRSSAERAWSGRDSVPLNEVDASDCLALTEVLVRTTLGLCGRQ